MKTTNACSLNTRRFGLRNTAVASNGRVLDYLRILNCERVNAIPAAAENHQRLYRLLFRNLVKRLAVTALLCAPCLAESFDVAHLGVTLSNQVYVEIDVVATLHGSSIDKCPASAGGQSE